MGKEIKIYTKTGDDGTTGLVGGSRVKKFDLRLEAYGTVDELNAHLGLLRSFELSEDKKEYIFRIQNKLFNIGSRLASDEKGDSFTLGLAIRESDILYLEQAIDAFENELPGLTRFILPGGDPASAQCHVARTVCRRAERRIVEFAGENRVDPEITRYMNRLSDFLFVLSRKIAADQGTAETAWEH